MKLIGTFPLFAAAGALVALASGEALAQYTPVLTVTSTGNSVTIEWTPIAGALGYTLVAGTAPGQSDIAQVNLPASVTRVVVSAPNGTYFLRVRATAGSLAGPFSNEGSVSVGLQPCVGGIAPVVTTAPAGSSVDVSWTAVPGATSYQIQWSRFSGGTELVETSTTTSVRKYVGVAGTFYVRVVAVTTCGNETSEERQFVVDLVSGLPRTPNPLPGGRLPEPDHSHILREAIAARPDLFNLMRSGGTCHNTAFLDYLVARLREVDSRYGYACRPGAYNSATRSCGTLLGDVVAYNWSDDTDEGTRKLYSFDVIYRHCTVEADWFWTNTQPGPTYIGETTWTGRGRF
jgi:hypothetical protein